MDAEPIRAAIYTRVSTEDQAKEGFSLDAQLDKLRSYCKARDWGIGGEYPGWITPERRKELDRQVINIRTCVKVNATGRRYS